MLKNLHDLHDQFQKRNLYLFNKNLDEVLMMKESKEPLTVKQLKQMAATYAPGYIRSFFGKTRGMQELDNYFARIKDENKPVEIDQLMQLLNLVEQRHRRVYKNKNPSRSVMGSTGQVYKKINLAIINYLITQDMNAYWLDNQSKYPDRVQWSYQQK